MYDQNILQLVKEEVAAGMTDGELNIRFLTEQCPWLEAVYHEVLRLKSGSSLFRDVTEDTVVGGKTLKKGNKVMVQYRQLHFNKRIWGENVAEFDPARFIRNKELARSSSFRPFGGGQHLCPGRFLARQVIFAFVALTLSRYEIKLADGLDGKGQTQRATRVPQFPKADESRPGLGTLSPVKGEEVIIQLAARRT